jgi:lantibiotic biosynthesis protein
VSVESGRVVLRSRRLGREIIPRLTSAHAVSTADLPLYRFLTALQSQDGAPALDWSWGPLGSAPRLPRVTLGRAVLAPAKWTLTAAALAGLLGTRGAARFRAASELRRAHRLPRWLSVGDGDQRLALDLDNVLCVDTLAELARDRAELELLELYPTPDDSCVGEAGQRFTHELAVPFVRTDAGTAASPRAPEGPAVRTFAPGSEWLTVKCYGGPAGVDRLLREVVAPLLQEHGEIERWFFLRYGDPAWHVRLRFQGPRALLLGRLVPALHDRLAPLLATGTINKVQLDTYQRELERYGGPEAMPLVEEIFHHDSAAALAIVDLLEGDEGADARWRLALRGCHDLLIDFGLDLDQRLALATTLRARFGAEHAVDVASERQLGQRYRAERPELTRLLGTPDSEHPLAPGLAVLATRSAALVPVVARLRALEERGQLAVPRQELLASLLHMHANRLLLAQQRAQELVLNDFLARHYTSERARARGR